MKYSRGDNGLLSGRADAFVYARNHVVRAMRMPSNPQTPAQTTQRTDFGTLSASWNSLTDAQRLTWNQLQFVRVDNLGHSYTVQGKDAYLFLNRNLFNVGVAPLTTAPLPTSPLGISSLTVLPDESTPFLRLTFTPTPVPADTSWLVYATAQLNPGVYRPGKSEYRLITVLPTATASNVDIVTDYSAVFGALVAGRKIFVKIRAIKTDTGFASPETISSAIVVV